MNPDNPRRLGRGLEALLSSGPAAAAQAGADAATTADQTGVTRIALARIRPNPLQPRKEFRPEELADLQSSIRANGLLQPIAVRPASHGSGYELIAGERRLRAVTELGWTDVPAVVREVDDRGLLTLALVENLQRADLDPLEEAEGYQRLIDEFGLTQQQVAEAVGKDRSTVANTLRLLALPASMRRMLQSRQLSVGHARALLPLGAERPITELAQQIVARGLTVRDVERRVREATRRGQSPSGKLGASGAQLLPGTRAPAPGADRRSAEVRRIEDDLRRRLQTDVHISLTASERGEIRINFYSADDLERLLELITGTTREGQ